jgi:hypothetical protein
MRHGAEPDVECPLPVATLNSLNKAEEAEVLASVLPLSEPLRVRLALYCYNRSHLRQLGLTVASTVDAERLAELGGTLGGVLAAQSREAGLSFGTEPIVQPKQRVEKPKPKVSLGGRGWIDR